MSHEPMSQEEYKHHVKDVYKTTIILSIITVVEVVLAILYEKMLIPQGWPRLPLKIFVIIASILKAYWIMAVFMHVKHETKGFIYSIFVPTLFLVWAIIAFSWEGWSWSNMRDLFNIF